MPCRLCGAEHVDYTERCYVCGWAHDGDWHRKLGCMAVWQHTKNTRPAYRAPCSTTRCSRRRTPPVTEPPEEPVLPYRLTSPMKLTVFASGLMIGVLEV
jgi:hypothetical protein